jgi:hypothetical protein
LLGIASIETKKKPGWSNVQYSWTDTCLVCLFICKPAIIIISRPIFIVSVLKSIQEETWIVKDDRGESHRYSFMLYCITIFHPLICISIVINRTEGSTVGDGVKEDHDWEIQIISNIWSGFDGVEAQSPLASCRNQHNLNWSSFNWIQKFDFVNIWWGLRWWNCFDCVDVNKILLLKCLLHGKANTKPFYYPPVGASGSTSSAGSSCASRCHKKPKWASELPVGTTNSKLFRGSHVNCMLL